MESKTLIIITPGFPKDENDTTCLPTQQLLVRTVQRLFPSLEIKVISLHYPNHKIIYNWHGTEVYPLNGNSRKGILRLLTWYNCYRLLTKLTTGNTTLGIISFWCNETALIGNYFSKRKNITHKIWISGQDARKENSFVRWIKPTSNDLAAMSDFLKTEFHKNHGIAADHVITNAVANTFAKVTKNIDVIAVGSLIPLKQYKIFIEVIGELKKKNPNISAVLFGKGPEENSLKQLITTLGLEKNIQMKGEVDHETLMQWMNRSKILVHPSSYEGYSTVCLEALANGCHVVSFSYAENKLIKKWRIVKDKIEMTLKVNEILNSESDSSPVLMRDIETTAKQMISLFGCQVK
jgi:glycosyltransferase involved in cell wall biosynthesis